MHINIVSIQKNIDKLRQLLSLLNYEFDMIGLSETKLNQDPLLNIDIEGYRFPELVYTDAMCGGDIKKSIDYIKRDDLSAHSKEIGETIFIEITQKRRKKHFSRISLSSPHRPCQLQYFIPAKPDKKAK